MDWEGPVPEKPMDYFGFIYMITNLKDGRKYVGKKFYKFLLKRPPLKGKKKRRHEWKETKWRDYYGSSEKLLEDVETLGKDNFKREILHSFETKWECAYYEVKYQLQYNVLFETNYYNGIVNCRLPKAPKALRYSTKYPPK